MKSVGAYCYCYAGPGAMFQKPMFRKPLTRVYVKKDGGRGLRRVRANLNVNDDPLLQAAIAAATLRFQETSRPEPLFVDPYVACMVSSNTQMNITESRTGRHCHCLATKFIDDMLLKAMRSVGGPRQVVLLTDGMDTRPYRLNWPNSTMIYEISPERVYREAAKKLNEVGARIPRSCLLIHVAAESHDIQEELCKRGFNGSRPSIWAIQGFPLRRLTSFQDVLLGISSLSIKETLVVGELPAWLAENDNVTELDQKEWINRLFLSHGFRADVIIYEDLARNLMEEQWAGDGNSILFTAEHLRLSDIQMENWRREFQRVEEDGEEEGFEEL